MNENDFWFYVDWRGKNKDECWEWVGALDGVGYGQNGKKIFGTREAHRIAWTLKRGPIPKGMWVLHKCDNRKCCRPRHLFLGNALDNMKDMINKQREIHPVVLSEKQITEIRELRLDGCSLKELSLWYKTAQSNISRICNFRRRA